MTNFVWKLHDLDYADFEISKKIVINFQKPLIDYSENILEKIAHFYHSYRTVLERDDSIFWVTIFKRKLPHCFGLFFFFYLAKWKSCYIDDPITVELWGFFEKYLICIIAITVANNVTIGFFRVLIVFKSYITSNMLILK